MAKPKPGACKHLFTIEIRNYRPVLVCMYCGKAVA